MSQVWEHETTRPQQSILLALADHADDDGGSVFPSVARIAWKTNYKTRQVQNIMGQLRDLGALVVVREATAQKPTEYRIHLSVLKPKPKFEPKAERGAKTASVQSDEDDTRAESAGVQSDVAEGCNPVHPNHQGNTKTPRDNANSLPVERMAKRKVEKTSPHTAPESGTDASADEVEANRLARGFMLALSGAGYGSAQHDKTDGLAAASHFLPLVGLRDAVKALEEFDSLGEFFAHVVEHMTITEESYREHAAMSAASHHVPSLLAQAQLRARVEAHVAPETPASNEPGYSHASFMHELTGRPMPTGNKGPSNNLSDLLALGRVR